MIISHLKILKAQIVDLFKETMEFKAYTDLTYTLASTNTELKDTHEVVMQHSTYGEHLGLSDQVINLDELSESLENLKRKYFYSLIHQHQVALYEQMFFEIIKTILLDKPQQRLTKKKQIDYATIFSVPDKNSLIELLVDRELNEIKYKSVRDWFCYLKELVNLDGISDSEIDSIAEAKASRDIIVHNAGVVNKIYIEKSGAAARFRMEQSIDLSGNYTLDTWILLSKNLIKIIDILINKFSK